jgi:hypothetical protein
MNTFIIILTVYTVIMYYSYNKVKNDIIELIRYRDSLVRFTFLQFSFSLYDYLNNRFNIIGFFTKIMFSHIGVASFVLIKEYLDKIVIKK